MHRLEVLAQSALGFDEKRGDVVTMQNVSFSTNVPEVKPAGMEKVLGEAKGLVGSQPGLMRNAMLGGLGVLLILFVLKPVAGQVVAILKEPLLLAGGERTETKLIAAEEVASEEQKQVGAPQFTTSYTPLNGDATLRSVTEHIRRDPMQSTRLLETWIGSAEESS